MTTLSSRARDFSQRHPTIIIVAIVALVYCASPAVNVGDSRMSLPTAVSMYRSADLIIDEFANVSALSNEYDVVSHGEHLVMGYPWPPSLFLVPIAAISDLVPGIDPGTTSLTSPNRTWIYEVPVAALLMGVAVALFFSAARAHVGRTTRSVLVATTSLAFGTVWWSASSRALTQHAAAAPFVALVLYLLVRSRENNRFVPWLGAAVAGAYVMRPTAAVLVVVVTLWVLLRHRDRFIAYLCRAALVAVPFILVNLATYQSVLPPYYAGNKLGGSSEPLQALAGLFVSPSRGILWNSPLVLLAAAGFVVVARKRRLDSVDAVFGLFIFATFLVVAIWPNWWGGSTFGPRLLSEIMPFVCWYLLPVFEGAWNAKKLVVASCTTLIGLSVLVNSQGALMRSTLCWNSIPTFIDTDSQRLWDWADPQPLRAISDFVDGAGIRQIVIGSCKDAGGQTINGG